MFDKFAYAGLSAAASLYWHRKKVKNAAAGYGIYSTLSSVKNKMAAVKRKGSTMTPKTPKRQKVSKSAVTPSNRKPKYTPKTKSVKRRLFVKSKPKRRRGRQSYGYGKGYVTGSLKLKGPLDRCEDQGVAQVQETSGILTDKNKVTYLGHSTMPPRVVLELAWASIVKKLFARNGINLKNWTDPISTATNFQILINTKQKDQYQMVQNAFTITANSTTLEGLTNNIITSYQSLALIPQQFLSIQLDSLPGGGVSIVEEMMSLVDCTISFFVKSQYKMQNRTVTLAGNDTSEDVDNVPLEGKAYEFRTNGTIHRDYRDITGVGSFEQTFTSHSSYGNFPGAFSSTTASENMYNTVPKAQHMLGTYKCLPVHLEPGEIRQSSLYDRARLNLNKLYAVIYNSGVANSAEANSQAQKRVWLGKSRLFCLERMIDAIATTDENQFRIAYEHRLEIGAITYVRSNTKTIARVFNTIVIQPPE